MLILETIGLCGALIFMSSVIKDIYKITFNVRKIVDNCVELIKMFKKSSLFSLLSRAWGNIKSDVERTQSNLLKNSALFNSNFIHYLAAASCYWVVWWIRVLCLMSAILLCFYPGPLPLHWHMVFILGIAVALFCSCMYRDFADEAIAAIV